jgi:hypothetical protein
MMRIDWEKERVSACPASSCARKGRVQSHIIRCDGNLLHLIVRDHVTVLERVVVVVVVSCCVASATL